MKRFVPWMSFGLFAAALGGSTSSCGSDSTGGGGKAGAGGGLIDGGGGTGAGGIGATGNVGATGGTGATGGSTAQTALGRACATDAECGPDGLTCEQASDTNFDGEGPAKGYCTIACTDDTTCAPFSGADPAVCAPFVNGQAFCFEGCTFGPSGNNAFILTKCHGRTEVACTPMDDPFTKAACLPQCNADADCGGGGLTCNAKTGQCGTTVLTGLPLGSTCVQDLEGGTDACKGRCGGLVHSGSGTVFTYMCFESCTTSAQTACGWTVGSGPAAAACLFTSTVIIDNGGSGAGDAGSCGQLCNTNCDCLNAQLVCEAWSGAAAPNKDFFQKEGYCSDPLQTDGSMNPGIACTAGDSGPGDAATD